MGDIYQQISEENRIGYGTKVENYGPTLLENIYSDKTHFIYELFQNAEDACNRSKKRGDNRQYYIDFRLLNDRLECRHNGIEFDDADLRSICAIAASNKKKSDEQIGTFGIGFKSVYAYTKSPEIYSSDKCFSIKNYVFPSRIEKRQDVKADETLFVIHFNNEKVGPQKAFSEIQEKLKQLGLITLLFTKNINVINCRVGDSHWAYSKKQKDENDRIELVFQENGISQKSERWLVFSKNLSTSESGSIGVAYQLNDDNSIIPTTNAVLVVYLPTLKETKLKFLLQGPYRTTPARDNIHEDDEFNKNLLKESADFILETILMVKARNALNVSFLETLPIREDSFPKDSFFRPIYDTVLSTLNSKELLPSADGDYVSAENAAISRTEDLRKLINHQQLKVLFGEKHNKWLAGDITIDKTSELRTYLMQELYIPEITPERFIQALSKEFLNAQNDEWIIKFYKFLADHKSLHESLKLKPIMRLENNEHMAAYNAAGKLQVYLPADTISSYHTVKKNVVQDADASGFLKTFGIEEPDIFAEIRETILPKYKGVNAKTEHYLEDFKKILNGYNTVQAHKKHEFLEQFRDSYIIDADNCNGEGMLRKPSDVYKSTTDLRNYFAKDASIYFVSEALQKFVETDSKSDLLLELKILDVPKRIKSGERLSDEEKKSLREKIPGGSGYSYDVEELDYEYAGLKSFLSSIDANKSFMLWRLLLKSIANKTESDAKDFFSGSYSWFYYNVHKTQFYASFVKLLRNERWLANKDGNLKRPADMAFEDLSDEYIKDGNNMRILFEVLGISMAKNDIIEQLPQEERKKLELTEGYSSAQLSEILKNAETLTNQNEIKNENVETWAPKNAPNEIKTPIEIIDPIKIKPPELEGQSSTLNITPAEAQSKEENKSAEGEPGILNLTDKKDIGDWGEKKVYEALKEKYKESGSIKETDFGFRVSDGVEVVWLNKNGNVGKGCDFIIKKGEIELEYIEVKTTKSDEQELIEITGVQWEFARKLYDNKKGEKYSVYVVTKAGELDARIIKLQNPIRLWHEGKLYAHPINFKLPPLV